MIIQSLTNPKIKHLVHLHTKSYRLQHKQFIAQGLKTCVTLLQGGYNLHSIYMNEEMYQHHGDLFPLDSIVIVNDAIMKKISTTITPSGIVAVFQMPENTSTATDNAIVLYNIADPGNVGTLIRTAAAMDISTVYLIEGVDPYNPKVIQATAGTIAYVTIVETDWSEFQKLNQNLTTCALIVQDGKTPQVLDLKKYILIIGNESQGLPQDVIDDCNEKLTIPMSGKTESLNAAVAGSIAMYLKNKN
ncbi:MAG TPA: RNA methyltransferase [Candidatus Saccharimonadales bacterium]|nr:RNA methyltransferase [Candidatus Saccharimonadales bacterium]